MTLTNSAVEEHRAVGARERSGIPLESLSTADLLELRSQITDLLPAAALKDMNLEQELVLQFMTLKSMQADVLTDKNVPANQRAQVANAVGATLQNLAKMQSELYTHERFKRLEVLLIGVLNSWPTEMTKKFFDEYEQLKI